MVSSTLRLSELVPKPPSPKQSFRIMQRASANNGSRGADDPGQESGVSKHKTLEEKQVEYERARQRIYGNDLDYGSNGLDERVLGEDDEYRGRTAKQYEESDPIPRHAYGSAAANAAMYQPVYPSLYHPPKIDQQTHVPGPPPESHEASNFAFPPHGMQYSAFPQMPAMQSHGGYPGAMQIPNAYSVDPQLGHQQYSMQQSMGDPNIQPNPLYSAEHPMIYPSQVWQHGLHPDMYPQITNFNQHPNMTVAQTVLDPMMTSQGWRYPTGMQHMMGTGQPMPVIPQGMQPYQTTNPYPPQPGMYPYLVQPTPMRPPAYPHSSSASSISSRSYHDGSRPHSRGSTTSTRSAASSVRLGAMFPAGQPPSYRQTGMKGQGFNGMTSRGLGERRHTQGHSPVRIIPSRSGGS